MDGRRVTGIDKQTKGHNSHKTVGTTDIETLIYTIAHFLPGIFANIYPYILLNLYKQVLIDTFTYSFTDTLARKQF